MELSLALKHPHFGEKYERHGQVLWLAVAQRVDSPDPRLSDLIASDLAIERVRPVLSCEHLCRRNFHFHRPAKKIEKDTNPIFRWK